MKSLTLAFFLGMPVLGTAFAGERQEASAALEECGAHPQAGMRECLQQKARDSEAALKRAEENASQTISKWDEDAKYVAKARSTLKASNKAFSQYREAHCAHVATLAGGAAGNALEMRRLACVLELNGGRARQLSDTTSELPLKGQ
ncbi:DUF1311 domain-containing protein [Aquabacterium sp. A7-Y]|uniref:lysozyme inhibitor LprI family protein n=1 Tax=Aquabacterium sp. A7-Y TaxID=1349605 RepID=UPI00223CAB87|nr:lysozyme inhibitor LprI family protein [Aquabacterium sp. A7-Y]MCW7540459.1 DUF1311 domain-containing protein [Aquabacterium sp. A7-Y]